jgi:hypothetical protein
VTHPETLNKTAGFSAKTMLQNLIPILAQAPASGGFLAGLSKALGLIMLIGFVYGVIKVIGGATNYNRDPG